MLVLDTHNARDLAPDVRGPDGRTRVMPAAFYAGTTDVERTLYATTRGIYGLPTVELVDRLHELIAGRPAIEIGAGEGVLAEALGIPATDNRQHERPEVALHYAMCRQPTVPYGPNIIAMSAQQAVRHYRPSVVVGSWVTARYDANRPGRNKGNPGGVDERDVLANCDTYVLVGNTEVHSISALWDLPHTIEHPPYLYSRAFNGSPDFIAVWHRQP